MATADAVGVESTGLSGSLSGISTREGQMYVVAKPFHEPVDRDFMTRNAVLAPLYFCPMFLWSVSAISHTTNRDLKQSGRQRQGRLRLKIEFLPLIRISKKVACVYRLMRRHTSTSA